MLSRVEHGNGFITLHDSFLITLWSSQKARKFGKKCLSISFFCFSVHIDYYTGFLIPALISARVDRISRSPKGEG